MAFWSCLDLATIKIRLSLFRPKCLPLLALLLLLWSLLWPSKIKPMASNPPLLLVCPVPQIHALYAFLCLLLARQYIAARSEDMKKMQKIQASSTLPLGLSRDVRPRVVVFLSTSNVLLAPHKVTWLLVLCCIPIN